MDYGHQLIRRLLLGIGKVAGARSVSILAPADDGNPGHTILLHVGVLDPTPELRSLATALRFHQRNSQDVFPNKSDELLKTIPSADDNCVIVPIWTSLESGLNPQELLGHLDTPRRRASDQEADEHHFEDKLAGWIGLRFGSSDDLTAWNDGRNQRKEVELWVSELTGLLSLHLLRMRAVMHDGLTGLPGLGELHQHIAELLRQSNEEFCILMFNPTNFETVNKELGRTRGDAILKAIADNVRLNLRSTDMLARFGSTVFAAVLPYTQHKNALIVANRVINNALNGLGLDEVDMSIQCGIAVSQAEFTQQPQVLVQQASQALRLAHLDPNSSLEVWNPNNLLQTKNLDPLISVFTGDMVRDYRRMALMWDTIGTIASQSDPDEMLRNLLSTLNRTLQADELHVYLKKHQNDLISHRFGMKFNHQTDEGVHHPPTKHLISIASKAAESGGLLGHGIAGVAAHPSPADFGKQQKVLAAPMMVGNKAQGCLVLSRNSDTIWLDVSDVLFVQGLAAQLAIALDRVYLADQERRRQKSEFSTLRAALGHAKMLYQSETMNNLVRQAEQVANIDATVLITGESGTGKGVLARAIHDLSPRRDKNFVIVDCAAIPPNLIESELFGHVKGAFTGADRENKGRLAEANQGTLFIDEIGELPAEVQGRLLTFVQDRQYFPVGSTRSKHIEVRIIAATNRRLEEEVKAGRFRQDLFFRLNVVNFQLPPLRQRRDEILMFARYFIEQYRVQYSKAVRDLSSEVCEALMKYSWPGNIRELQHRVLRAVIFSRGEEMELSDIELPGINIERELAESERQVQEAKTSEPEAESVVEDSQPVRSVDLTLQFSDIVRKLLQGYLGNQSPWPFFPSIEFELIRAAHDWSLDRARQGARGSTVKRASERIGVPTATYRRKLQEAERTAEYPNGTDEDLRQHSQLIRDLVDTTNDTNLIRTWKQKTFELTQELAPKDTKTGAQIFGTSEQTWRNWLSRGGPA